MEPLYLKIIETTVVVVFYLIFKKLSTKIIHKTRSEKLIHESRGTMVRKVINLVLLLVALLLILLIWGVKQSDLGVFIGSLLTVVGVAFFAQWSLLSNITSSIIIFFNHPIKLNDDIRILEGKDYTIEGKVIDIGIFFLTLRTKDSSEIVLPNNVFILKSIQNISQQELNAQTGPEGKDQTGHNED